MRVVVTGGAGFIGTVLVRELGRRGHEVTTFDLADCLVAEARSVLGSVLDLDAIIAGLSGAESVVHLAGPVRAGVRADPFSASSLQLQGTLNILEAARRCDVPHVALASSFYVYDGLDHDSTVDELTPLDPRRMELFGSAKYVSELLCTDWAARTGAGTIIFRLGPAYGGAGSSAVDQLVADGLAGRPVEIWGRGDRRNQYTHVADIASGICAGLVRDGETYNLVSPEAVTLAKLGELLVDAGFAVVHDESKPAGPWLPRIDATKAHDELGWCSTPLVTGLAGVLAQDVRLS